MIIVGGGGREDDIAFCMTFIIWELDGHQDVWKRDLLCTRINRKDLKISMIEGIVAVGVIFSLWLIGRTVQPTRGF